jgi:uncharacterized protein YjgD (DUF1641 family)
MAKSIRTIERKIPIKEEVQAESVQEILEVLSDNRESIVSFLGILKEVHEAGVLDIGHGILQNRRSLEKIGLEFINVALIPGMLKNIILFTQFLGRLDPKQTEKLIGGLGNGLNQAMQQQEKPTSMWGLFGQLRDPNVTASVSMALHFLRGMGEELRKGEEKGTES